MIEGNKPKFVQGNSGQKLGFTVDGVLYSYEKGNIISGNVKKFPGNYTLSEFTVNNLSVSDFNVNDNYFDSDGDAPAATNPFLLNKATPYYSWTDADGNEISKSNYDKAIGLAVGGTCENSSNNGYFKLPLTLKIYNSVKPFSQYGIPHEGDWEDISATYKITAEQLVLSPTACYVQPNLVYDSSSYLNPDFLGSKLDGNNWVSGKGYKIIDIESLADKFPTTGSHGLYFYLLMNGLDAKQALAINGDRISAEEDGNVSLSLSVESSPIWRGQWNTVGETHPGLKVTLNGPRYNSGDKSFRPVTFKLYANKEKTKLLYQFRLERWYIVQPGVQVKEQLDAKRYCRNLGSGYRLPDVNDFTNANNYNYDWDGGIPGRSEGAYLRRVSYRESPTKWQGGLFSEWGCVVNTWNSVDTSLGSNAYRCGGYNGSDWDVYLAYWSNTEVAFMGNDSMPMSVSASVGEPMLFNFNSVMRVACVTP